MHAHTSESSSADAPPGTRLGGVFNHQTGRYEFAWVKPRIGGGIYDVWRVEQPNREPELHLSANLIVPEE